MCVYIYIYTHGFPDPLFHTDALSQAGATRGDFGIYKMTPKTRGIGKCGKRFLWVSLVYGLRDFHYFPCNRRPPVAFFGGGLFCVGFGLRRIYDEGFSGHSLRFWTLVAFWVWTILEVNERFGLVRESGFRLAI